VNQHSNTNFSPSERIKIALATLGGIGFIPKMPGTAGSLAALVPILLAITLVRGAAHSFEIISISVAIGIVIAIALGLWVVPFMEKHWGNDPGCVIIDELVGMWIVLLFVLVNPIFHHSLPSLCMWMGWSFALFRLFDITKPFPISYLNNQKGAFFVMFDDVLAGIYACGGLFFLWLTWQQFGR
jgi:phosphatidylglycerophosphatase A